MARIQRETSASVSGPAEEGLKLLIEGKKRKAIAKLSQAVELAPSSCEAHLALAAAFCQTKTWARALEALSVGLGLGVENSELMQLLIDINLVAFMRAKLYAEVLCICDRLEGAGLDCSEAANYKARCYWALGRTEEAQAAFLKAVSAKPEDPLLWSSLAVVAGKRGDVVTVESVCRSLRAMAKSRSGEKHELDFHEALEDAETVLQELQDQRSKQEHP